MSATTVPGGAAGAGGNATQTGVATLPSFYAMRSCLPFNALVQPAAGGNQTGNATLTIIAEPAVISALQVSFSENVLTLSVGDDFQTNRTIKLTLDIPDSGSLKYVQNFGIGDVILGPGFSPQDLSVTSFGLGGVYATNVSIAGQLQVQAYGTSTVSVSGDIRSATVRVDGTSKAYVTGNVTGNVSVALTGISTAYVQGAKGSSITGTADGLSKVLFTDGSCSVRTSFQSLFGVNIFGNPCNRVDLKTVPTFNPVWTCGLLSRGRSMCSSVWNPPAAQLPVTPEPAGGAANASTASASFPPGGGTSTVTGPGGTVSTTTTTSGPGATASAGGFVGGIGVPPTSLFQQSIGGAPPQVFGPISSTATTSTSAFSAQNRTAAAAQAVTPRPLPIVEVTIPEISSGVAVVSLECIDTYPQPIFSSTAG